MQGKTARVGYQEVGVLNTTLQENAPLKTAIFSTNATSVIRDNTQLSNVGTNIHSSLTQHQNHNKLIVRQRNDKPLHLPTPIKLDKLAHWLQGYEKSKYRFLLHGFKNGFCIKSFKQASNSFPKNLKSALQYPNIVSQKIAKEVKLGRIAGPFSEPPFEKFTISPIGLQPKRQPGEFRLIHHLSYPKGSSVNDAIPREFASVNYATIDDAILAIKTLGRGCFMSKTDIKSAFRIIPINPKDYPLMGLYHKGKYYFDKTLAMGLSSSCSLFEEFSTALEWAIINKLKAEKTVHILDDFLFLAKSQGKCSSTLDSFLNMATDIGVPIAEEKTVQPTQCIIFMGIELDSLLFEARLPQDKLQKCRALIREFLNQKSVTLRSLQSLIGVLNFACSVIVPGRTFLRRLIDLTIGVKQPYHHIKIKSEVKLDLTTWLEFLDNHNGINMFIDECWASSDKLRLYTDASGSIGYGGFLNTSWFYGKWPVQCVSLNITILELYPIVLSLYIFGQQLKNKCVLFLTDNEAVVHIINRQTSKDKQIMILVRLLVTTCLRYNINFRSKHVAGKFNNKADALSRLQIQKFRSLAPEADPDPNEVPQELLLSKLLKI